MSRLKSRLADIIRQEGPLSVAQYMSLCLGDPKDGYYMTKQPIGREGDFVTAPEVSQIFGELIAIWCIETWHSLGAPERVQLVEGGPGRGTLMADILRAAKIDPGFHAAVSVSLLETSPTLRDRQSKALAPYTQMGVAIQWIDRLDEMSSAPVLFIANELFDALPIHQYIYRDELFYERVVTLTEHGELAFGLRPAADDVMRIGNIFKQGEVHEQGPAAISLVTELAERIRIERGAALIIDYGYDDPEATGDTLQAVRDHEYSNPLANPGEVDLTAHVDFAALASTAAQADLNVMPVATQGKFLIEMGLLERAGKLGAGKSLEVQEEIRSSVQRLAAPDQMGQLFKFLAFTSQKGINLPGWQQ